MTKLFDFYTYYRMVDFLTQSEVLDALEDAVCGNQKAWAKANDMAQGYVNDVLNGRRSPGPKILKALGLKTTALYEPIAASPREGR